MMKVQSRSLIVLMAGLFLSSILFSAQPGEKTKCPRKVKVQVAEIKGENFSEFVHFEKEISPLTVELKAAVAGKIKEVLLKVGDEVKSGDVLVILDSAALGIGLKEAADAASLWEKTLAKRKGWKVRSEKAEQQAEAKLSEAKEKLAAQEKMLGYYVIKSTMDGKIEKLTAEAGMDVIAGAMVAMVSNDNIMKFSIAGEEIASLTAKEKVFVMFAELSSAMNGQVNLMAAYQADILLENSDSKLKRGLKASFKILKKEYSDVIVLKQEQILQDDAGAYVYLAEKGRAKKALLTLGAVEEGKVLVLAGLDKGGVLVVSSTECLSVGKKIKILNPIAKKMVSKAEPQPVAEVVKEEVPETPMAAAIGAPKKFKVGLNFEYHYMTAEGFSGIYGRAVGGGIEFSYLASAKIELWISGSASSKKKNLDWTEGTSKYSMIPVSVGVKYYLLQKEKLAAFVGGGLNYIIFNDTSPLGEVKENLLGFNILGGGNYKLSRNLYGQMLLKFNTAKKKMVDITPPGDFPLDLNNFELKIGVFYAF